MPAPEHLSGRQFLYHESHLNDRESIRAQGLRASVPYNAGDLPRGVYMSPHGVSEYGSSMNDSSHFGYDRWRVDVSGMDLHVDQSQPTSTKFHAGDVHPSRIKLVKKGHPNWERHI